ncbi:MULTISPECIES: potassium/proton antiporter [Paenibacillus]|uniref:Potassium/proton antiporter n=1 Tax=Paenibacillus alvei TaxID=44250 RepID=A0ABT4EII3_PAEAL|nr:MULTISPECIES: potassium/proton antiporter [Paenibacillus]MCY9532448.1 potassium/proton antiporter [Paenibacillus alvei]
MKRDDANLWTTDMIIFLFGSLLLAGVISAKFSNRFNVPSLVLFIIVGMALNPLIYYDNAKLTQLFGILALIIILFDGGMQTSWRDIRPVIGGSVSLATIGVMITATVFGVCSVFILGIDWKEGMLIGAIVGSTDAAAVFAVLGSQNVKKRLTSTLEAESGTNDPMAVFLTISFIEWIQIPDLSVWEMLFSFVWQMGLGLGLGLLAGWFIVQVLNRIALDTSGMYPILAIGFAILTYSGVGLLKGSGFLAVYVMALVIGNSDLQYRFTIVRFNEGFAWLMQIMMFILLGLLVFPLQLLEITWQGLVLSILLMFVARPLGVFISLMYSKFTGKEKTLIAWAGLKGAVPIVMATYPMIAGLEHGQLFFNIVFFIVLTSALIQGATISPLAKRLGLAGEPGGQQVHALELVSVGKTNMDLVKKTIEPGACIENSYLHQLRLPDDTLITAIIRGEEMIAPKGTTQLLAGDVAYVLVAKNQRDEIRRLFTEQIQDSQCTVTSGSAADRDQTTVDTQSDTENQPIVSSTERTVAENKWQGKD